MFTHIIGLSEAVYALFQITVSIGIIFLGQSFLCISTGITLFFQLLSAFICLKMIIFLIMLLWLSSKFQDGEVSGLCPQG